MQIGLIIIGDEILSGKRQDQHLAHVIALLKDRRLSLSWCQIIGDDPARITTTLRQAHQSGELVFCCGGIGATPDDYTRQCAAEALERPLTRHPGAEAEIIAQFGEAAFPNRVLMADLPDGATLIPNPKNRVPGFSLGHLHFVPGFPEMAWPMIAWVLDQQYPHLPPDASNLEVAFILPDAKEADLLGTMQDLLRRFPAIRLSSLPSYGRGDLGPHIELGLKGPSEDVKAASHWLKQCLHELGQSIQP